MLKKCVIAACFIAGMASVAACDKIGVQGRLNHFVGNWAEVNLPAGCVAQQIAAEGGHGTAVLCRDGRVFH